MEQTAGLHHTRWYGGSETVHGSNQISGCCATPQSLFGTNWSAQEIIESHLNAHLTGTHAIQIGGGTFFDLFAKKGRNEWDEVERLIAHFRELGVRQSALIRGDFSSVMSASPMT